MYLGINLEFARLLLEGGCNVLFADISLRPESEKVIAQYQSKPKAVYQKTDVASWVDLDEMFRVAIEHFGQVDIVCPGAGIFEPPWSNFWVPPGTGNSRDKAQGDRYITMDINVTHPIRVTQMAISHFLAQSPPPSKTNPKSIIHISSIAGEVAGLPTPLYYAGKHAIKAFVRSLGDLQNLFGIRVAAVLPGIVKTPLWTEHPDKLQIVDEKKDAWIMPEDIGKVMLDLVVKNEINSKKDGSGELIPIEGGSCVEVLSQQRRDVPLLDNVGPVGGLEGATVSDAEKLYGDIVGSLKPGWGTAEGQTNGSA